MRARQNISSRKQQLLLREWGAMLFLRGLGLALADPVLFGWDNFTLLRDRPRHRRHVDHFPTHLLTLHPHLPLNKFKQSSGLSTDPKKSTANLNATTNSNTTEAVNSIEVGSSNDDGNSTEAGNRTLASNSTLANNTTITQNTTLSTNSSSVQNSSLSDATRWSYIRNTTSHRTDCHKPGLKENYIHFHRPYTGEDLPDAPTPILAFYTPWHLWYPKKVRRVLREAGFEIDEFPEGQWRCGWVHDVGVRKGNVWLGRVEWAVQCRNETVEGEAEGSEDSKGAKKEHSNRGKVEEHEDGKPGNPNCFYGRPERDLVEEVRSAVRRVYPEEELAILLSVSLVLGIALFWVIAWWVRKGRVCGAFGRWEGRRRIRGLG